MKLQIALDTIDISVATEIASAVASTVDRIEVGTPLLLRHGIAAIETIREAAPQVVLVADTKTMDYGPLNVELVAQCGADGIIIQGAAADSTLFSACLRARELGLFVMIDSLGLGDWAHFTSMATELSLESMIVHLGKDEQGTGRTLLDTAGAWNRRDTTAQSLAVAGGISPENIAAVVKKFSPDIAIVGEFVWASADPSRAVEQLLDSLTTEKV